MQHRFISHLRPHRRRWGLTQRELAYLIGLRSGAVISRLEGLKRTPSLAAAIACAIVFDAELLDLFPTLHLEVQDSVFRRANDLYEELQGNSSPATKYKLDFLEDLLGRGTQANSNGSEI